MATLPQLFVQEKPVVLTKTLIAKTSVENAAYASNSFIQNIHKECTVVKEVKLIKKGNKEILGLWKKPHVYRVNIVNQPVITLKSQEWAIIKAELTNNKDMVHEVFDRAIESGDYRLADCMIHQGFNINSIEGNDTWLNIAGYYKQPRIGLLLLEHGANVSMQNSPGNNVLNIFYSNLNNYSITDRKYLIQLEKLLNKKGIKKIPVLPVPLNSDEIERDYHKNEAYFCKTCQSLKPTYTDFVTYNTGQAWEIKCKKCNSRLSYYYYK